MPVTGLPPVLENILNICLQDKKLTVWKVEGIAYKIHLTVSFEDYKPGVPKLEKDVSCQNWIRHIENAKEDISFANGINYQCNKCKDNQSSDCTHWKIEVVDSDNTLKTSIEKPSHERVNSIKSNTSSDHKVSDVINQDDKTFGDAELFTYEQMEKAQSENLDFDINRSISDLGRQELKVSSSSLKESFDNLEKHSPKLGTSESLKSSASSSPTYTKKKSGNVPSNQDSMSLRAISAGNSPIRDNTKILSKVIKIMKRSTTHCNECNKIVKPTTKSKCTVCDVFICSDCVYNNKHNPEHKKYISMFSYPTDVSEDYCRACGYVSRIKHSYNTNFSCDLCPEYLLCQGCMSQGMHGHHENYLKPILLDKKQSPLKS